jgi:hypothetical protein
VGLLWLRGSHYEAQRDTARAKVAELQATLDQVKVAQKQAADAAHAARLAQEAKYTQLAETTDAELETARKSAMDAADRYIQSHSVRPQATGGSAGGPGASSQGDSTQGSNGPGAAPVVAPDLVTVSPADIRICTENSSRLVAVRQWAVGLSAKP